MNEQEVSEPTNNAISRPPAIEEPLEASSQERSSTPSTASEPYVRSMATDPRQPMLDGYDDARSLVRLFQCSMCSYLLRSPVTLPCGKSLCRQCLPQSHLREFITYPVAENGHYGITCPFAACGKDHPVTDCSVNVVMTNLVDAVNRALNAFREAAHKVEVNLDEILQWSAGILQGKQQHVEATEKGHTHAGYGGRLFSTFDFVSSGQLHYTSEISYQAAPGDESVLRSDDEKLLKQIKELCRKEVDCEVCYALMLDPTTTPCGHTFCRRCLVRHLDHSNLCAVCRRKLFLPYNLKNQASNAGVSDILQSFWCDQVTERAEAAAQEESSAPNGLDMPIFVCTNAFPGMRTFLHIFEPRYRLMMRRAMERNGQFGMIAYNQHLEEQGSLGRTQFMLVGTVLQIDAFQPFPDGRSFVQCHGLYRFKVRAHGVVDGYVVASIDKLEDISIAEEEQIEASETARELPPGSDPMERIEHMSTAELFETCLSFVRRGQDSSQRWFSSRLMESYGEPPEDPATLPFWLAAILPFAEDEKYKVLPATSVRERLKITAKWIRRIESQRW